MKNNQLFIGLIIWTFLNIVFFAFGGGGHNHLFISDPKDYFWPFSKNSTIRDYDITEFLVYVGTPWALYLIMRIQKK
jgi:hypothetical protein